MKITAVISYNTPVAGIDVVEITLSERHFPGNRVGNRRVAVRRIPVDVVPESVGSAVSGNGRPENIGRPWTAGTAVFEENAAAAADVGRGAGNSVSGVVGDQ